MSALTNMFSDHTQKMPGMAKAQPLTQLALPVPKKTTLVSPRVAKMACNVATYSQIIRGLAKENPTADESCYT